MYLVSVMRFKKLATGEKLYKARLAHNGQQRNTRRTLKRASDAEYYGQRVAQRFETIKSVSVETARSEHASN